MKVTMIVLLKAGLDITISSGNKRYYPTLKKWDHNPHFENTYEREVLYIKIQSQDYKDKTTVVVDGIDREKFS